MKPEANYTKFDELMVYAGKRAKISAGRGGHQEYLYWMEIREWAFKNRECDPLGKWTEMKKEFDMYLRVHIPHISRLRALCRLYAYLVHVRKMLVNSGRDMPRLSLDWLRVDAREQVSS